MMMFRIRKFSNTNRDVRKPTWKIGTFQMIVSCRQTDQRERRFQSDHVSAKKD